MPDIDRLLNAIDAAEESAYGGDDGSELQRERAFALDYYYGRNIEPAEEGRSQVVDRSVFETVQWILPSLCRIFANGDAIVEFTPVGEDDIEKAQQEGDYLNYLVTQKNPWFQIFLAWAQDALLMKNAYCMAYIEEKVQVETETYENQSDEAVAMLMQESGVELLSIQSEPDMEAQPVVLGIDDMGQPVIGPPQFHTITIRRTKPQKRLRFKVLPPERCKIAEATASFSLEDCDYFEFWDYKTISSLREMGFAVEDDISSGSDSESDVEESRNLYDEELTTDSGKPLDPAMRQVRVRMVWIRHDYDEDGISELQKVIRVGRQVLTYMDGQPAIEQCSRIPVSCIVPNVNTHRHVGTSLADMVIDIQRIQTAILRQGLDSLYQSQSPRHAISDKVNLDDMSITAPGWNVRLEDGAIPGEGHILPLVTEFVFPQAMAGLEYFDQVKEKRTGLSRFSAGVDPDILNKSPSGVAVNQMSTMAAQRVEQIARIIASGIEYLFSVAHELILKSGHQTETVKLRNKWVQVDPSSWRTGRDMRIVVGYGAGNKDALLSRITMILTAQKEAMAGGLRVASEQNVYEALVEMTKAADYTAPERFWTDPSTLPPPEQKPTDAELYANVEVSKIQSNEKVKLAEMQKDEQETKVKTAVDKYKADLSAEVDIFVEQMKRDGSSLSLADFRKRLLEVPDPMRINSVDALVGLADQLRATQVEQQQRFDQMLNSMSEVLMGVIQNINAPRELVRDASGKVVGVKVNGQVKAVRRENGKVVGTE